MDITKFIFKEGLIAIPALYIIAEIVKHTGILKNKWIPLLMLVLSVIGTPLILPGGYTPENLIQAILVAGETVFVNQLIKQTRKDE